MKNEFKPYREYRQTEDEWLGAIPKHWQPQTIRSITRLYNEKNGIRNDLEILSVYREYGVVKKSSRNDNHNNESNDLTIYKVVDKGNLVLNKMKMWQGSLGVSKYKGIVSSQYTVCKLVGDFNFNYIHYLLRSAKFKTIYNRISYGVRVGQWVLRYDDFKNIKLYIPPLPEQDQIVKFLDIWILKINNFVRIKKKLISALKEQHQTIISEAVTNGINPTVKMKPSGIEWVREIPEHWEIKRNKNFMDLRKEVVGDEHKVSTLLSLSVNGIIKRDLESGKGKFPSDFSTYQKVYIDDLVFCLFDMDETPRTVGLSSLQGMITSAYTVFKVQNVNKEYLYYYYLALDNIKGLKPLYTGLRKTISTDVFLRAKVPYPPENEQLEIINFIKKRSTLIEKAINGIQQEIQLITEYRDQLISDVVTGKVDVRDIIVDDGDKYVNLAELNEVEIEDDEEVLEECEV